MKKLLLISVLSIALTNITYAKNVLQLAQEGNVDFQYILGVNYEYGQGGFPKDYNMAIKWYMKAADQGNPNAMANLANMYKYEIKPPNYQKAKYYYKQACSHGRKDSCYDYDLTE